MIIREVECPNCGAPIDFGDSTRAACPFCRSILSLAGGKANLAGTPADRVENTPAEPVPRSASATTSHWADFSEVEDLLRHGQKSAAIRLYREQTGTGAKEAQYVVEAIARHETPVSLAQARALAGRHSVSERSSHAAVYWSVCGVLAFGEPGCVPGVGTS